MEQYRKPDQYYVDQYDGNTISQLREIENSPLESKYDFISRRIKFTDAAVLRARRREGVIKEWMREDENKDCLIKQNTIPEKIRCNNCNSLMEFYSYLFDHNSFPILFLFRCIKGHLPRKVVHPNGKEYIVPKRKCDECGCEITSTSQRKKKKLICTDTCVGCGRITVVDLDLSISKQKPTSINEEVRKKYCLDYKDRSTFYEELQKFADLYEYIQQSQAERMINEEYSLDKIKKPTIPQMEQRLAAELEKLGFIKLQFEKPEMQGRVKVPFNIQDPTDRNEKESMKILKKTIKNLLFDTNWRLESGDYRLGFITGSLKIYESSEDLLKIAKEMLRAAI